MSMPFSLTPQMLLHIFIWVERFSTSSDMKRQHSTFERALHLGFDPVATSVSKAAALNVLKRFDEALAACEQAFQAGTQDMNAAYYDNKGRALYGFGTL